MLVFASHRHLCTGLCNKADRCECFARIGTKSGEREAYTGFDCSEKVSRWAFPKRVRQVKHFHSQVCAYGQSSTYIATKKQSSGTFALPTTVNFKPAQTTSRQHLKVAVLNRVLSNRDTGVDLNVMSTVDSGAAVTGVTFRYKLHDMATFFPPTTAQGTTYTSLGSALELKTKKGEQTGIFVYFDLPSTGTLEINAKDSFAFNVTHNDGDHFSGDSNSAHQMQECSAQGKCNRRDGQCMCDRGFSGDACQRMDCPGDCGGHGVCTPLKVLASEAGYSYTGYDAEQSMTCICDDGWSGVGCQVRQCPSKADPMGGSGATGKARDGTEGPALPCSGRGACISGYCVCHHGFLGEACEEFTTLI